MNEITIEYNKTAIYEFRLSNNAVPKAKKIKISLKISIKNLNFVFQTLHKPY